MKVGLPSPRCVQHEPLYFLLPHPLLLHIVYELVPLVVVVLHSVWVTAGLEVAAGT